MLGENDSMKEGQMRGCGGGREGSGENELGFWKKVGRDKEEILQEVVRDEYLRQ